MQDRVPTSADPIAAAVQNVARHACSKEPTPSQPPATCERNVTATVVRESLGGPPDRLRKFIDQVEVEGELFRRERDQAVAREGLTRGRKWDRLMQLLADRPEARGLIQDQLTEEAGALLHEFDACMRRVGVTLVTNGQADLWRLVYIQWGRGDLYILGDEMRFLRREPPAAPQPIPEV